MAEAARDKWAEWLLSRRWGGDADVQQQFVRWLYPLRDRVLDGARLEQGHTLLDVGTGDGLIALGALDRVGPEGTVVFSDISRDLLDYCRAQVAELGATERCRFLEASADDLAPVADGSVDAVTTRSVLIYVSDKARAFAEFWRVLRPGGRISLFEPINTYFPRRLLFPYHVPEVSDLLDKVGAEVGRLQPPGDPMLDFDDRDLVRLVEAAGFSPITLQIDVEVLPPGKLPWQTWLRQSGNPHLPATEDIWRSALSAEEIERLTRALRPLVEAGHGTRRSARAYVQAVKPPA